MKAIIDCLDGWIKQQGRPVDKCFTHALEFWTARLPRPPPPVGEPEEGEIPPVEGEIPPVEGEIPPVMSPQQSRAQNSNMIGLMKEESNLRQLLDEKKDKVESLKASTTELEDKVESLEEQAETLQEKLSGIQARNMQLERMLKEAENTRDSKQAA